MKKETPFIAVRDTVIIEPDPIEDTTKGGIILSKENAIITYIGTVVAIGWDQKVYKVGARILYSKYGGMEFEKDDTKYLVLEPSEILAVMK